MAYSGREKDLVISHTNPMKHVVREIAPWTDARLLSWVIEQGAYEQKPVGTKKLVQLWLCRRPELPPDTLSRSPRDADAPAEGPHYEGEVCEEGS